MELIPFNKPYLTGRERLYIDDALASGSLSGNSTYAQKSSCWLESNLGTVKSLITPSCTASLEMCALLLDIQPYDEVILPSFTFVSTANAFVLRGAVPVFVDIDPVTLNICPNAVQRAITSHTKAVVAVHYAGHSCQMQQLASICSANGIALIEDAAQAILSKSSDGRYLGTIGDLGCLSFHETKNIISGEGGALLINNPELIDRAHTIQEKGTNRRQFLSGNSDKYTWHDVGSSYYPCELTAAFLYSQLECSFDITSKRRAIWSHYYERLSDLSRFSSKLPRINYAQSTDNAHIFYILLKNSSERQHVIDELKRQAIMAVFHYIPLHSSPAGTKYGRTCGEMTVTDDISSRLLRLPIWIGLNPDIITEALCNITL